MRHDSKWLRGLCQSASESCRETQFHADSDSREHPRVVFREALDRRSVTSGVRQSQCYMATCAPHSTPPSPSRRLTETNPIQGLPGISAAWVGSTVLSVFTAAGIILIEAAESPTFSSAVGGAYHSLINTRYLLPLSPVVFSVTWAWVSVSPWRIAACIGVVLTLAAGIATSGVIAFTRGRKVKFGQSTPDLVAQNRSVDETAPHARLGDP